MQEYVFFAGKFRMKTRTDFDQCREPSADGDVTASWSGDARKQFQDRGFSGSVVAHDAEGLAFLNFETDVAQSPHFRRFPRKRAAVPAFGRVAVGREIVFLRDLIKLEVDHQCFSNSVFELCFSNSVFKLCFQTLYFKPGPP